jgi:hypothetical protein
MQRPFQAAVIPSILCCKTFLILAGDPLSGMHGQLGCGSSTSMRLPISNLVNDTFELPLNGSIRYLCRESSRNDSSLCTVVPKCADSNCHQKKGQRRVASKLPRARRERRSLST